MVGGLPQRTPLDSARDKRSRGDYAEKGDLMEISSQAKHLDSFSATTPLTPPLRGERTKSRDCPYFSGRASDGSAGTTT